MSRWSALVVVAMVTSGVARASEFDGRWIADDEDGRTTLTLRTDAQGAVQGNLTGPTFVMTVQGRAQGASFDATARMDADPTAVLRFRGGVAGGQLRVTLLDAATGEELETIVLRRDGAAPGGPAPGAPAPGAPAPGGPAPGGPAPAPQGNPLGGNPLGAPAAPFAGTFEGDGIALELAAAGPGYEGTLTFQGTRMPCKAAPRGDGLSGTFSASGHEYPFEATRTPQGLSLASGGQTYPLTRKGGNPLAGGPAPNPLGGSGGAAAPADLPVEGSHPNGVGFRLPRGWQMVAGPGAVRLLPEGARADDPAPDELHLVLADQSQSASDDPAAQDVATYMDQLMGQTFPALRRAQPPQRLDTPAGRVALYTWTGNAPDGTAVEGKAWVMLLGRTGTCLMSVCATAKLRQREATLGKIAGTFKAVPVQADTAIAGGYFNNGGWRSNNNNFSGDSHSTLTLGQDGRVQQTYLSYISTPAGVVENKEEKSGTYTAAGGVLTLRFSDGSGSSYRYQKNQDGSLTCTSDNGAQTVWRRR